jgi:hypothetical protein
VNGFVAVDGFTNFELGTAFDEASYGISNGSLVLGINALSLTTPAARFGLGLLWLNGRGLRWLPLCTPFASIFRSTCGAEREAPECTTQRLPAATPHVGQGTDNNCLRVMSEILIQI